MKYYIVYKNNHLQGYTNDKLLLDNFIKNRKGNYKIYKLKESNIPKELLDSFNFNNYQLSEYINYSTDNDVILFNYEASDMEDLLLKDLLSLESLLKDLLKHIKYFKFDENEVNLIRYALKYLLENISSITETDEPIFDEIVDINKYFYKRYLPNRKCTKDIIENSFINDD